MKRLGCLLCILLLVTSAPGQDILALIEADLPDKKKADSLQQLGRKFHMKAKPDSAEYCFSRALTYATRLKNNNTQVIQLYSLLSRVYQMKRESRLALKTIREADRYLLPDTEKPVLENYYYFTAQYFRLLQQYDSAIAYLQKAESINHVYQPYNNWYIYDGMAEVNLSAGNWALAEEYYLKAYELTRRKGIRMDHGLMIARLGNLYSQQKNAVKFAQVLREHEQFIKQGKKDYRKDPIHSLMYINWGNTSLRDKVDFILRSRQEHIKNGYSQAAAFANYQIAALLEDAGEIEEGLKYLYENRDFFLNKEALADNYPNLQYIYRLQIKANKHTDAVFTANQLFDLNNKLSAISSREMLVEMEEKYNTEKKEKEIVLLNAQNKLNTLQLVRETEMRLALERENRLKDSSLLQQEALARLSLREKELQSRELEKEKELSQSLIRENELKQTIIRDGKKKNSLLLTGIILLGLSGLIIGLQFRRQILKNRIIQKQREDLEMLNREIHHRVKNNLQVISSLLDLQSEASGDPFIAEKFLEGSQRVQSMAFIHQNLYQGDSIDSINVKDYVNMLTESLIQSYNTDTEKISLTTDIDMIRLHSDTVIPLGMIINELVSNSLKYAFKAGSEGRIDVILKKLNEHLLLRVKDNGSGMPASLDINNLNSFGYKIIRAFVQKLKGSISINNQQGADVQVLISKFRIA